MTIRVSFLQNTPTMSIFEMTKHELKIKDITVFQRIFTENVSDCTDTKSE